MKLVRRDLEPDGPGSINIIPEEDDDMWHAYNLISEGDLVQAVTVRKVLRELASGGRDSERVKLKLEIKVEVGAADIIAVATISNSSNLGFVWKASVKFLTQPKMFPLCSNLMSFSILFIFHEFLHGPFVLFLEHA
ncbi:hypothetical protein M5K25_018297 [Dendrobium thyrsiflorum]|uniref:eRF1/Pelota-like N-terminal domain-containing protein n=1 Tax=Dendrobium thyrsiflorum TaxID=117978 RepID=A0ABD0UHW5_DENTH